MMSNAKSRTFTVPFNRDDMAAFIGTNRSALSRELSRMKDEGLLDYYKNTFRLLKN
jgi:CRP-like cAMP-binding protein